MTENASPVVSHAGSVAPMDYPTLLSRLPDRDRTSLERQMAVYEKKVGAAPAQRWRNLACILMTLAPIRTKLAGSNAMQFYIPDGKYRKQVFALQALSNGAFAVYAPDVLVEAVQAGLLSRGASCEDPTTYHLPHSSETLGIDAMDGKTPNLDNFYKDLTGWNRKAIRVTLPADSSDAQVRATNQLCALAATQWT